MQGTKMIKNTAQNAYYLRLLQELAHCQLVLQRHVVDESLEVERGLAVEGLPKRGRSKSLDKSFLFDILFRDIVGWLASCGGWISVSTCSRASRTLTFVGGAIFTWLGADVAFSQVVIPIIIANNKVSRS